MVAELVEAPITCNTGPDLWLNCRAISLKNQLKCSRPKILRAGNTEERQEEIREGEPTHTGVWLGSQEDIAAVEVLTPGAMEALPSRRCLRSRITEKGWGAPVALGR